MTEPDRTRLKEESDSAGFSEVLVPVQPPVVRQSIVAAGMWRGKAPHLSHRGCLGAEDANEVTEADVYQRARPPVTHYRPPGPPWSLHHHLSATLNALP